MCSDKNEYVESAASMAKCNAENVLIIGCKLTESEAKAKLEEFISRDGLPSSNGIPIQLVNAIRKAGEPVVRREYYSVITSYFHVSEVEFDYSYTYNGNSIDMSPSKRGANMDISVFVETLDGRYTKKLMGNRVPMDAWNDLRESECVDEFEEGFVAHKLLDKDVEMESKASMRILEDKLEERIKEIVQDELGSARKLDRLTVIDEKYTYNPYVFAAPFYIFQYDTGKKIITISVDAYSGEIGFPIVNNPLGLAVLSHKLEEPDFSILFCVIFGVIIPVFGAVLYGLDYFMKKIKYENSVMKGTPKFKYEELKQLI